MALNNLSLSDRTGGRDRGVSAIVVDACTPCMADSGCLSDRRSLTIVSRPLKNRKNLRTCMHYDAVRRAISSVASTSYLSEAWPPPPPALVLPPPPPCVSPTHSLTLSLTRTHSLTHSLITHSLTPCLGALGRYMWVEQRCVVCHAVSEPS